MLKWKVCGMREEENIQAVLALKPDYMGFIFFEKSKRDVSNVLSQSLLSTIKGTKKIGVFVNASIEFVTEQIDRYSLDVIQLHGEESPEFCHHFIGSGVEVIKVFSVGESFDFSPLKAYLPFVDFFLFDTKGKEKGGNGFVFDWSILEAYNLGKPFFLSGGIGPDEVGLLEGVNMPQLYALDVNSKLELSPALKDVAKVEMLKRGIEELNN